MNTLRRRLCAAAGLACGLPAALRAQGAPAAPVLVKGQAFERQLQLAGSALVLNGTGVRTVAWFTGFVAGLYLTARASTAAQAVAMPGPKRLRMRLMHDVPTLELAKAFKKGVARNSTAQEQAQLSARMLRFEAQIRATAKVRQGDVIDLDLDPTQGMNLRVNGTLRGEPIAGADFYAALLRSFVGDQPFDGKLKAGLLGGASAG
ncbi:MAG: chalcone isomerase family protein [Rubrivivax sp.]|jgi:hypothetical protein|nr:chalcone isomerase family protein [Rubrivivax sp.]